MRVRKRDLVGRRIVDVRQVWEASSDARPRHRIVETITLDNGAVLTFAAVEFEADYGVELALHRPRVPRGTPGYSGGDLSRRFAR